MRIHILSFHPFAPLHFFNSLRIKVSDTHAHTHTHTIGDQEIGQIHMFE